MQQCTDLAVYEVMKPSKSSILRIASIEVQRSGSTMRCRTTKAIMRHWTKKLLNVRQTCRNPWGIGVLSNMQLWTRES